MFRPRRGYGGAVRRTLPLLVAVLLVSLGGSSGTAATSAKSGGDWTRFGYDAARSSSGPATPGITAANVRRVVRQRVVLDGTVDASPIYLRGVRVAGRARDVFFVTTTYGKTLAIDAGGGRVLWRFTPSGYASWVTTSMITNATPLADPGRRWLYAVAPNGLIHKLSVSTGREAAGWPVAVTRDPEHEKIAPALNFSRGRVLVATGGYIGDAPPYQGHVVVINAGSGRIEHVWNSLCSNRGGLLAPSSCPESDSAIWARSGVVVVPGSGNLLVATGNATFDGSRYWGDSVLMLSAKASRLLQNWTPTDQASLNRGDVDLGSTAPALLSTRLAVQGGKDGKLRLLDLRRLNGRGGHGARTGGELQTVPLGDGLFSAPAVWHDRGQTWVFVSTFSGTHALRLVAGRLAEAWTRPVGGTSPVVAGGLLYVYNPDASGLYVYRPATGVRVALLPAGSGHWNSPIVTDGRIALPEGNANDHVLTGVLDIYRVGR
jgi:outer membrane protein assembly factor BamB